MKNKFWITELPRYSIILFVLFNIIAMFLYAGGNLNNHEQVGYVFIKNFFSDLGRRYSYAGDSNIISCVFFNTSLTVIGFTFIMLFYRIKDIFNNSLLIIPATFFGICGGLSYIGVALSPSDVLLDLHIIFAHSIFRFLFIASVFYSIIIYRTKSFDNKYAAGFIIFSLIILFYVIISELGPDPRESTNALLIQAISQKVIAFWILISIYIYSIGLGEYIKQKIKT